MTKKITLTLVGLDGNAFSLIAAFRRQARREGWADDQIKSVVDEMTNGDYDHLLSVLMDHCEPESE